MDLSKMDGPKTRTVTCGYCGRDHKVRWDDDETTCDRCIGELLEEPDIWPSRG